MLSLINIRVKYLKRHPCLLCWSYLFLPGIILFITIVLMKTRNKVLPIKDLKNAPKLAGEDYFFDQLVDGAKVKRTYDKIVSFLPNTIVITNDDRQCDNIVNYIEEETNTTLNCSYYTNNFTNDTTHIIKIEKIDNKYKIFLIERQREDITPLMFSRNDLNQDLITDLFYLSNITNNKTDISIFEEQRFKLYWELESLLAKLLIKLNNKEVKSDFKMNLGYNSYPEHYRFSDVNTYSSYSFLSFIIALQFSLIAYNFNMRMIDEKENKLNIFLERQGISKYDYNVSWFVTFCALFSFSIVSFTLFTFISIQFRYILTIINMMFFSLSIFSACVFFTTCIKSTKTGTTAVKFFNFGSILLGFVIVLPKTSKVTKLFFSLIPQINLYLSICSIFNLENFETMSWDKLWLKANRVSYMETILIYIFDIVLYLGLSIIIQSYKESGLEFYDYIKSFFTNVSRNINITDNNPKINEIEKLNIPKFETNHQELSPINKQKKEQNMCLKIINVSKNFDELKAVDNFNGELFSNEIFCLLGHNGAGKTTLVNMISGIYDPNQGDILFNGKSLVTNKNYLYENIGLCQQEDIFFEYLTVQEHLEYMCKIKGSKINKKEIQELINKIELTPKKDALCSTLSGGQKRKLCIALALIGGSQIILLDEPTSGMDVMARRKLWDFLKNYKKDKIILLTTHFLDEAEYLGDRIGIMSDGKYLCSGTSSFLKSKYPCGFNLNFIINSEKFNDENKERFFEGIQKLEPKAEIRVASKGIFTINIQSNNKNIPQIFDYIELKKNEYGIDDYTVSSTSLEDVFLKINNKASLGDIKYIKKDIIKAKKENAEENEDYEKNKLLENKQITKMNINIKTSSFLSQLFAQVKRGMYPLTRNKILFVFELLSGLGFVYIFIFFFSDFIIHATTIKLSLLDVLNEHNIYYYEKNTNNNYIKNSFAYDLKQTIPLKRLKKEPKDIIDFMNLSYDQAFVNIAKGGLYVDNSNTDLINVYNTEVDTSLNGYFYANTMLFVSAFLKNNYDINAVILSELEMNALSDNGLMEAVWNFLKDFIVLIVVCLITLFGFVIFLGGLMFEKIREKRYNIKHLLYLSGCNIWSYWLGFFIVDYFKLIFYNIFLMLPIFYVSGVGTYFGLDMLAISLSSLSFIYFISFFCTHEDEGAKILFFFVFGFLIIITALSIMYPDSLLKYSSSFTELYKLNIMDLTPVTSMGLSFLRIIISFTFWDVADRTTNYINNVFNLNLQLNEIHGFYRPKYYLYTNYIAQAVNFVFYSLLLVLAESGLLGKAIHSIQLFIINTTKSYIFSEEKASEEFITNNNLISPLIGKTEKNKNDNSNNNKIKNDSKNKISTSKDTPDNKYVQNEKEKLKSDKDLSTKISGLRKTFFVCCGKNVRAINNLYLGLEPNEKFGLLGFNGSGKTTTFRAITNEILTDCGSINLFGYDNQRQFKYIRTLIGYCPQINPLFDFMKVREIIKFYSELKTSNETVESICAKFGLSKYLNTYTINLSGGNKRKLTFAIAMMNKPTLLLLDEPSTGVDPESRRTMWRNINELSNTGHKYNMILTTHSMEEAEILCDTVSWLKSGNFICLGNPEELKIEYSVGYKLHIKFDDKEINKEIKNDKIEDVYNNIKELVDGFDIFENIILNNKNVYIENYLNALIKVVGKIKDKTKKIMINEIGKDMSFELVIEIIKEKQKELFSEILNMKNIDKEISEMSISMQSLENILTSLN